jgi:hypothetical protein
MVAKVLINSGAGNGTVAQVTSRGELVVGDIEYSQSYNATADVVNTGYDLVPPISTQRFVITGILVYANKNVGASDATVVVYEGSTPDTTTVDKTIMTMEMPKNTSRDITGLRIIVTAGKWVLVKTDDDDIFITIIGYCVRD